MQTDEPTNTDPMSYLRDALRKPEAGEKQVQGMLVRIDCDAKGIIFTLKSGAGLLKLRTASFEEIDITTFAPDVAGEITCGVRKPENAVVVCYLPESDVRAKTEGTIRSLEFVPNGLQTQSLTLSQQNLAALPPPLRKWLCLSGMSTSYF